MNKDQKFAKWQKWLDRIFEDIQGILINRHVFWEVQEIIRSNKKIHIGSIFYQWMGIVYPSSTVIGIRRQLDMDKRSISFARLLTEIINNPETISRERFIALYKDSGLSEEIPNRHFDRFSGVGLSFIDKVEVESDLIILREKTKNISKFANKRIAHCDKANFKNLPTFAELDECLNYLESLLNKYLSMLRAQPLVNIVPEIMYDWKKIFRYPWIESENGTANSN